MVARLGVPGVLGAIFGAGILTNIEVTAARQYVYAYLLILGLIFSGDRGGSRGCRESRRLDCAARIWRRVS